MEVAPESDFRRGSLLVRNRMNAGVPARKPCQRRLSADMCGRLGGLLVRATSWLAPSSRAAAAGGIWPAA